MRFTVPQFIDMETKVIGPLTFKQFGFMAVAGALTLFLYFAFQFSFIFLLLSALLFGASFVMAFVKINGQDMLTIMINFIKFNIASRVFLWGRRKTASITIYTKSEIKKKMEDDVPVKMTEKGHLKRIKTLIDTR